MARRERNMKEKEKKNGRKIGNNGKIPQNKKP